MNHADLFRSLQGVVAERGLTVRLQAGGGRIVHCYKYRVQKPLAEGQGPTVAVAVKQALESL